MLTRVGHRLMAAKGHSPGFTAELDRYPDYDVTIILLGNSYGIASQDPIREGVAAIVFGQDSAIQVSIPHHRPTISVGLVCRTVSVRIGLFRAQCQNSL